MLEKHEITGPLATARFLALHWGASSSAVRSHASTVLGSRRGRCMPPVRSTAGPGVDGRRARA